MGKQRTFEDDLAEMRDLVRQGHEVLKDLNASIKVAEQAQSRLLGEVAIALTTGIETIVKSTLDGYSDSIEKAIEEATDAVYARFDTIAAMILGTDNKNQRQGNPTLMDYAHLINTLNNSPDDPTDEDVDTMNHVISKMPGGNPFVAPERPDITR